MEFLDAAVSFSSALLGGLCSLWVAKRYMFSRKNIMESVDSVLDYVLNTVEGQSKVKAVMEKISEGLLKGAGLGSRGGRKPNLQDIIISMVLQYAQSKGMLPAGLDGQQNPQQQSNFPFKTQ